MCMFRSVLFWSFWIYRLWITRKKLYSTIRTHPKAETQVCVASHQTSAIKRETSNLANHLNRRQNTLGRGHWRVSTFGQNLDTDWQCNKGSGKGRGNWGQTEVFWETQRVPGEDKGPWVWGIPMLLLEFLVSFWASLRSWNNKHAKKEQDPSIPSSLQSPVYQDASIPSTHWPRVYLYTRTRLRLWLAKARKIIRSRSQFSPSQSFFERKCRSTRMK